MSFLQSAMLKGLKQRKQSSLVTTSQTASVATTTTTTYKSSASAVVLVTGSVESVSRSVALKQAAEAAASNKKKREEKAKAPATTTATVARKGRPPSKADARREEGTLILWAASAENGSILQMRPLDKERADKLDNEYLAARNAAHFMGKIKRDNARQSELDHAQDEREMKQTSLFAPKKRALAEEVSTREPSYEELVVHNPFYRRLIADRDGGKKKLGKKALALLSEEDREAVSCRQRLYEAMAKATTRLRHAELAAKGTGSALVTSGANAYKINAGFDPITGELLKVEPIVELEEERRLPKGNGKRKATTTALNKHEKKRLKYAKGLAGEKEGEGTTASEYNGSRSKKQPRSAHVTGEYPSDRDSDNDDDFSEDTYYGDTVAYNRAPRRRNIS